MALPLSNAAENEDELAHEFDTAGYAQLPADHLSDSSESNGAAVDPSHDTFAMSVTSRAEQSATTHNAHIHDSTPHGNGSRVHSGLEAHAAYHGEDVAAHISHVAYATGLENEGASIHSDELCGNDGHVVYFDGMEIHVYGQLAGLQLSSYSNSNVGNNDDDEGLGVEDIVDESERQLAEDAAFQRAKEADDARRSAPLPPDRCQTIKTAMQSISLGGFRPKWADRVPEDQWINRLRKKSMSKNRT